MPNSLKNLFSTSEHIDTKSYQFLLNAMEKNNIEGFDYLKFKQSLKALSSLNMDPDTAIKSTFATASTMGLTKDNLIKTATHYKNILSKEKEQFDKALEKQISDRIESRKAESVKLYQIIEQCEEQIKKLEEKIKECKQRIENTDNDIQDAENRIMSSKEKFESTFNEIVGQIEGDIESFKSTLA